MKQAKPGRGGTLHAAALVLAVVFVCFKLLEWVNWPWWVVLSPLWGGPALFAIVFVLAFLHAALHPEAVPPLAQPTESERITMNWGQLKELLEREGVTDATQIGEFDLDHPITREIVIELRPMEDKDNTQIVKVWNDGRLAR